MSSWRWQGVVSQWSQQIKRVICTCLHFRGRFYILSFPGVSSNTHDIVQLSQKNAALFVQVIMKTGENKSGVPARGRIQEPSLGET